MTKHLTVQYTLSVMECPCGSGKLPKRCCGEVKPRILTAQLDPRNYHESDGIAVGMDYSLKRIVNGDLKPLIGKVKLSQGYSRKKNNKIIIEGEVDGEYVMNPESTLLGYDAIFSIDTNTKTINKTRISVTGIVYSHVNCDDKGVCVLSYLPLTVLEFWDAEINAEVLGWIAAIRAILEDKRYQGKSILIIVDSVLGDLDNINMRSKPIFSDFYLPDNFTMMYASSDVASNLSNKLIKASDKMASMKLQELSQDLQPDSLKETPYPCRLFRQWMN